jgi:hypothetical protein
LHINEKNAGTYVQGEIDRLVQSILQQMEDVGSQSIADDVSVVQHDKRSTIRVPIELILGLRLMKVENKDVPLPKPIEMKCKDISLGGVLLSSLISLSAPDVRFALVAPLRDEILYCWVKVTWSKKVGNYYNYGCRFVEMPELEVLKLRFFVACEQQRIEEMRHKNLPELELYRDQFICDERHMSDFVDYVVKHQKLPSYNVRAEALPDILYEIGKEKRSGSMRSRILDRG